MSRIKRSSAVLLAVVILTAGCGVSNATTLDKQLSNTALDRYQANQPIPQSDYSQYRQTAIDVENAQIHGVATTTFFYNQGNPNPIKSCPSVGFPVSSTSQLTNPQQITSDGRAHYGVIGQLEPNGTYTGDSAGTYVVCVDPKGLKYISYWEGFVETEGGPAHWDNNLHQIVLDGEPTVVTKAGQ